MALVVNMFRVRLFCPLIRRQAHLKFCINAEAKRTAARTKRDNTSMNDVNCALSPWMCHCLFMRALFHVISLTAYVYSSSLSQYLLARPIQEPCVLRKYPGSSQPE